MIEKFKHVLQAKGKCLQNFHVFNNEMSFKERCKEILLLHPI